MPTTTITIIISALSALIAACSLTFALVTRKSNTDKAETSQMTTMIVKLENIGTGVNEIKSDMRTVRQEVRDLGGRLIIVEQSDKALHTRMDRMDEIIKSLIKPNN